MGTFRLSINEQRWTIRFVRRIRQDGHECDGLCDFDKREIRLRSALTGQALTDTLIHEVMHAAGSNLHEEFVEQTARDIAAALYHPRVQERL